MIPTSKNEIWIIGSFSDNCLIHRIQQYRGHVRMNSVHKCIISVNIIRSIYGGKEISTFSISIFISK